MPNNAVEKKARRKAEYVEIYAGLSQEDRLDITRPEWTPKQRAFIEAYLQHRNASRAAATAYDCKPENAGKVGWDVMQLPHVRAFLEAHTAAQLNRYAVTPDRIIEELAKIAFGGMADIVTIKGGEIHLDFDHATADELNTIAEVKSSVYLDKSEDPDGERIKETTIKRYDRLKALETLGRLTRFRMFAETNEMLGDVALLLQEARARRRSMVKATTTEVIDHDPIAANAKLINGPEPLRAGPSKRKPKRPPKESMRNVDRPEPWNVKTRDLRAERLRNANR